MPGVVLTFENGPLASQQITAPTATTIDYIELRDAHGLPLRYVRSIPARPNSLFQMWPKDEPHE